MLTDVEKKVIEILVSHKACADAWRDPIHAVDKAMGWASEDTRMFVRDLIDRRLIRLVPHVRHGPVYHPEAHWEREGEEL
jgi:hypothetical protein